MTSVDLPESPNPPSFLVKARFGLILLILVALAIPATAQTASLFVYLDLDNDPATGCTVSTVDGPFDGVEQILETTVDTTTDMVTAVDRIECTDPLTDTFGAPMAVTPPAPPWPVGGGLGVGGSDVAETSFPTAAAGFALTTVRLGFEIDVPAMGADALLLTAGGGPILLNVGAPPGPTEIPTVGEWGLLLFSLLLAGLGVFVLRHRPGVLVVLLVCTASTGVLWAMIAFDGNPADWISAPITDPTDPIPDLQAAFAETDGMSLFFRFDAVLTNDAPVAQDDTLATAQDTQLIANVLVDNGGGADTDADGDPLAVDTTPVSGPSNGTLSLAADGMLTYDPDPGYVGPDTFIYTVRDGRGGSDTATVSITVTDTNETPTVDPATFSIPENSPVSTSVGTVTASDPDAGQMVTFMIIGGNASGAFAINATTGEITVADAAPLDFETTPSFSLTVQGTDDGVPALTGTATITVDLTNVDEPPVAVADSATVTEDDPATVINVLANDTDVDGGPMTIQSTSDPAGGTVVITGGGTGLTYQPDVNFCNDGTPTDDFTYTLNGGSMATVAVTVTCVDDPPVAVADTATVNEDAPATTIDVQANDTDPDGGTNTIQSVVQPANGTVVITNAGADLTYQPNANFCNDGTPTDDFTYTLNGGSMATVAVTVTCVADPPMAVADSYTTVGNTELAAAGATPTSLARVINATNVLANDSDPVEMTAISIAGIGADTTAPFTGTTTLGGDVTMNADGSFVYVPPVGVQNRLGGSADTFQYTLQNAAGGQTLGTVSIEILDELLWYVHNDPAGEPLNPAGGDGRSNDPFDTLVAADPIATGTSGTGDHIFVFEGDGATTGQSAGIELTDNQTLLGHTAATLTFGAVTVQTPAPGGKPKIDHAGGSHGIIITNRTGVEIRNLDIAGDVSAIRATSTGTGAIGVVIDNNTISAAGAEGILVSLAGSGASTVTASNNTIAATGNGFDARTTGAGDLELAFDNNTGITSAAAMGAGVHIEDVAGAGSLFVTSFSGNAVLGTSAGDGVRVLGAIFDGDPTDADFDPVAGGSLGVGIVSDRVGGAGLILGTPASRVLGNLGFTSVSLFSNGGVALAASGAGASAGGNPPTAGFQLAIAGGTADGINGPAVALDPLTSNIQLTNISSSMSPGAGVLLDTVDGTFSATMGGIVTSTGPGFEIVGGTVSATYGGGIVQSTNAPMVSVSGGHTTGTVTFNTGTLSASAGNGLQFDNADGTYNFDGTTTLAGGDAGIDILNGSGGTFSFSAAASITDPAGPAFNLAGGTAAVTYRGGISQANNAAAVSIGGGHSTGTVRFDIGTVGATGGTGLQFNNADGIYQFEGTTTLGGGDAGIDILGGSDGTFTFATAGGSSASITNPTGPAFNVNGGGGMITYGGTIANNSNRTAEVTNRTGGSVTFQTGTITDTGATGIRLASNGGGTTSFNGNVDITNSTSAAVTVQSNTGGTTSFANLDIDNSTSNQVGILATANGGAHTLSSTTGTVDAGTAAAIDIDNTILGLTLVSVDSMGGSAVGIELVDTTGSFTVGTNAGGEVVGDGGTIMHAAGNNDAILLNNATNVTLRNMLVDNSGRHGIHLVGSNGFTLANSRVEDAGNGDNEHGLFFENVTGTNTVDGSTITRAANDLFRINNVNTNATINVQNASTFADTNGVGPLFGNDGILLAVQGTSVVTLNVNDSFFDALFGNAVQVGNSIEGASFPASGTVSFNADNNTMTANPADLNKATNFAVSGQDSLTINLDWTRNTFTGTKGPGTLQVDANDTSTVRGRLGRAGLGNTLNNTNTEAIGLTLDESATMTLIVEANDINTSQSDGILVANFGGASPGPADLDLTLRNNSIDMHNQGAGFFAGISVFGTGAAGGGTCLNFVGNTITNTPGGFFDYAIDDFGDPNPLLIQGPGATPVTCPDVETLNGQVGLSCAIGGTVVFSGGAACDTPP